MNVTELLTQLSALSGPAGFEDEAAARVHALLTPYMDEITADTMGNVIAVRRCGRPGAKRVLLDAHMDEIGFIITGHEEGFLRFAPLGGPDARMLPASELKILTDPPMTGVVCTMPPHVLPEEEREKVQKTDELVIDVGLDAETAAAAVALGTPAVYAVLPAAMEGGLFCGKALDNRASLAAILRALDLLAGETLNVDLYVCASVQEEVGLRGAMTAAYSVSPDYAIVVDVGHGVTPDCKNQETCPVGEGVIISIGPNMNRALTNRAVRLAKGHEIPHQISVEPSGNSGTNARAIQISRDGVATALLGVPLKYMHAPREVVSTADVEAAAALIARLVTSLEGADNDA